LKTIRLVAGSVLLLAASLLTTHVADAEQVVYVQAPPPGPVQGGPQVVYVQGPPPGAQVVQVAPEGDHGRFRGGIEMDFGLFKPPAGALGAIGPSGQLGYQINNLIGVYAVPGFNILFGSAGGLDITAGAVVDFTILDDQLTIGAGPEFGAFAFFGSTAAGGGGGYGGRIHAAWNAIIGKGADGVRRKGLVIGLDLRFIIGPEATASASNVGTINETASGSASTTGFTFAPMLSVGYVAF
jgi:hypothetical protein